MTPTADPASLEGVQALAQALTARVAEHIVGQAAAVELLLIALLSEGHVLLEGVPGVGKTRLAQAFAQALDLEFKRAQFTPDLLPGDLLGTHLYDFRQDRFVLERGPVFTQLLLADEINRSPPKTQAALLEAMQERAVTLGGQRHDLGDGFLVVATQNPLEHEGTYPLPEAQLDRFLFRVSVGYPSRDEERAVVRRFGARGQLSPPPPAPVADLEALRAARAAVADLHLADPLADYAVDLVRATRETPALRCGASPRASVLLCAAARARAALHGRAYVLPDDLKALVIPALAHRVILAPGAELEGRRPEGILQRIVDQQPAPR